MSHDKNGDYLEDRLAPSKADVPHVQSRYLARVRLQLCQLNEDPYSVRHEDAETLGSENQHDYPGSDYPGRPQVELSQRLRQVDARGYRHGGEGGENEEGRRGEPLGHLDSLLYLQRPHDPLHHHAHEDVEARPCPSSNHMHVVQKVEAPRREGGYEDDGRDYADCEAPLEKPAGVGGHPRRSGLYRTSSQLSHRVTRTLVRCHAANEADLGG